MSVNIWTEGDVMTVKTFKVLSSNVEMGWSNTYEVRALAGEPDAAEKNAALVKAFAGFEAGFALADVQFPRGIVSTYEPDGEPYDPTSFVSVPLSGVVGAIDAAAGEAEPIQMCLRLTKSPSFGRAGFLLLRRSLLESYVTSTAGTPALSTVGAAAVATRLTQPYTYTGGPAAQDLYDHLADIGVTLVMASGSPEPSSVRTVNSLGIGGITVKKHNNRYFDRA